MFHYNNIELIERNNGYHLHSHITVGVLNDVSLLTIEDLLFDTWSNETFKVGLDKISRKGVNVTDVTKTVGGHSNSYGDKSIEELSKIKGTLEWWEKEYLNTFPKKTSQEIGKEIIKINRTFKGSRRGRIWKNKNLS